MDYEHHNSFSLLDPKTGKTMDLKDDFGGMIINTNETTYDRECMPQLNFITDKNDNRDGETFVKAKYGTRVIDITIFLTDEGSDLDRLKMWLNKDYQQWFEWENGWGLGLYVIEQGGWKSQVYYGKNFNGKIDLKFIAHKPFYTFRNGKEYPRLYANPQLNTEYRMGCIGNVRCYPLIKITPNGIQPIVQINWNGLIITLNNVDKPIYLDCAKEFCYEMNNNVIIPTPLKFYSDAQYNYPYIDPNIGNNKFVVMQGNLTEVSIAQRTRVI